MPLLAATVAAGEIERWLAILTNPLAVGASYPLTVQALATAIGLTLPKKARTEIVIA